MFMRFQFVPKSMTLNDLWARFKVINSSIAAKIGTFVDLLVFIINCFHWLQMPLC